MDGEATQDNVTGIVVRKVWTVKNTAKIKVRARLWNVRVLARLGIETRMGGCWVKM